MAKKNRDKKQKVPKDGLLLIKDVEGAYNISKKEITDFANIDYPIFSFKYLKGVSIDECKDYSFFFNFLMRLQKLSELGWKEIFITQRHGLGMEKLPVSQIVPKEQLPPFVTREASVDVFRSSGDNRTFVGIQQGKIFHIFFIEAKFGDVCKH